MKIADYGKAITSYIESPTTAQKLKSKKLAGLMDEYLGDQLDYQKAVDEGFQGTEEEYRRYKSTSEEDRVFLAEGSEDIVEPSKSMQVDTTTKGLDLFTIDDFKEKAYIYVGALHNAALPTADIKSALNKFTQKGIDDGTFTADDAVKVVKDLKFQFQDRAQKQRLRDNIIAGTGTVERKDFQDGLSVQTLDPVFPTQDSTSTDFKPLDLPGAIIPPLAIGAGAKRFKDIFLSKDKGDDKKNIQPSDDKGSDIEPPKGPKFDDLAQDFLVEEAVERLKKKEMDVDKRTDKTLLARDLDLDIPKSGLYDLRKDETFLTTD